MMLEALWADRVRETLEGAAFVLRSPLSVAAAAATALMVAPENLRRAVFYGLVFACVAGASGWLPIANASSLAACSLVLLGAAVACGIRLHGPEAWIALLVGGLATGLAGGMQTATVTEAAGGGLVLGLLLLVLTGLLVALHALLPRQEHVVLLGQRMAGAWIGAVGVLFLALWIRAE